MTSDEETREHLRNERTWRKVWGHAPVTSEHVGQQLTVRTKDGGLFRGVVKGASLPGAYVLVDAVNLGRKWERLKSPELRLLRGTTVVEDEE